MPPKRKKKRKKGAAGQPRGPEELEREAAERVGRGDVSGAEALLEEALRARREAAGEEGRLGVAAALHRLAGVRVKRGAEGGAEAEAVRRLLEEALAIRRAALGERHPDTAESLHALGDHVGGEEGVSLLRQALSIRKDAPGPARASVADTLEAIAMTQAAGPDAVPMLEESLQIRRAAQGSEHLASARTMLALGTTLKSERGDELIREAVRVRRAELGNWNPQVADALEALGRSLDFGRHALGPLEEAVRIRRRRMPSDGWLPLAGALEALAAAHKEAGKRSAAVPLLHEVHRLYQARGASFHEAINKTGALVLLLAELGAHGMIEDLCCDAMARVREDGRYRPQFFHDILVRTYMKTGRPEKALLMLMADLDKAEARRVANWRAVAKMNLACHHALAGRLDLAFSLSEEAMALGSDPGAGVSTANRVLLLRGAARVRYARGENNAAVRLYEEADRGSQGQTRPVPEDSPVVLGLVRRLVGDGRVGEARDFLKSAALAGAFRTKGSDDEFLAYSMYGTMSLDDAKFVKAVTEHVARWDWCVTMGDGAALDARFADAVEAYTAALEAPDRLEWEDASLLARRSAALRRLPGRAADALRDARRCVELDAGSEASHACLLAALHALPNSGGEVAREYVRRGRALLERDEGAEVAAAAAAAFRRAVAADPRSAEAREGLGEATRRLLERDEGARKRESERVMSQLQGRSALDIG